MKVDFSEHSCSVRLLPTTHFTKKKKKLVFSQKRVIKQVLEEVRNIPADERKDRYKSDLEDQACLK